MKLIYIATLIFLSAIPVSAAGITVLPETVLQGDPIIVTADTNTMIAVSFNGKTYPAFPYKGKSRALIGIDINQKPGSYILNAIFSHGETISRAIAITERVRPQVSVAIPKKLGGSTPQSNRQLINSIARENASLENLRTGTHAFWTKPFIYPVKDPIITNPYGFGVNTGQSTIAHRGTDFRAPTGTKILAMNRGVVRVVRNYRVYGKTIVVDHGLGLQTLYLHLSKTYVNVGQLVLPGQVIGLSGDTGYASGPHLHLSVRFQGVSIDPIRFLDFFKAL